MNNANLYGFYCANCIVFDTSMNEVKLQNAIIENSSFMFARLDNANFNESNFDKNIDFYEANMNYVNAAYSNFTQCDLNGAKLSNTIFNHAMFINSSFSEARMHKVSMQYTKVINGNFTKADLSQSNWRYAYCERCIFDKVNLTNADLFDATFIESDFRNCIITEKQLKQTASLECSILPNGNIADRSGGASDTSSPGFLNDSTSSSSNSYIPKQLKHFLLRKDENFHLENNNSTKVLAPWWSSFGYVTVKNTKMNLNLSMDLLAALKQCSLTQCTNLIAFEID